MAERKPILKSLSFFEPEEPTRPHGLDFLAEESNAIAQVPDPPTSQMPRNNQTISEGAVDLHIKPDGTIVSATIPDEDWAAAVAYATQMGEIVGQFLGMEGFRGLDCQFKNRRWIVGLTEDGDIKAVRAENNLEADAARAKLGLL